MALLSGVINILPTQSGAADGYLIDVPGTPIVVVNADTARTNLFLRNVSQQKIRVGSQASLTAGVGFHLNPGEWLTVKNTGSLYGVSADATGLAVGSLSVWWEH